MDERDRIEPVPTSLPVDLSPRAWLFVRLVGGSTAALVAAWLALVFYFGSTFLVEGCWVACENPNPEPVIGAAVGLVAASFATAALAFAALVIRPRWLRTVGWWWAAVWLAIAVAVLVAGAVAETPQCFLCDA